MKVYAEAYGCAMNRGEAGEIIRVIQERGGVLVRNPFDADAALIATCVVIDSTERKMLRRIQEMARLDLLLMVTGCAGGIISDKILFIAPRARIFLPGDVSGPIDGLSELTIRRGEERPATRKPYIEPRIKNASVPPFTSSGEAVCPIPIATGCLGQCAYCLTRVARGRLTSRPLETVVREARGVLCDGGVELQMCGQDAGIYGADIGSSLPELVDAICNIELDFMVRLGMMNPLGVRGRFDAILGAYRNPKVFKFLHMPVQSGDDAILESMGRGYAASEAMGMMKKFRDEFPESTISTDVIVGYPGEDEDAHQRTVEFIGEARPDIVNVTRFSPRPGTVAFKMRGIPHGRVAKARSRELSALRTRIARDNNARFVGSTVEAVVTEPGKEGTTVARTRGYKPVVFPGVCPPGVWHSIRITRSNGINLFGAAVKHEQHVPKRH